MALRVSVSSVHRWSKRLEFQKRSRRPVKLSEALRLSVQSFLAASTRFSTTEVIDHVKQAFGLTMSRQLTSVLIHRLGFSFKRTRKRFGQTRTVDGNSISSFCHRYLTSLQGGSLVSIDESGFNHRCVAVYGYAKRGEPAIVLWHATPDRRRISLLMAIHCSGSSHAVTSASCVNGASFAAFIRDLPYPSHTTLLLDNASIHKTAAVK